MQSKGSCLDDSCKLGSTLPQEPFTGYSSGNRKKKTDVEIEARRTSDRNKRDRERKRERRKKERTEQVRTEHNTVFMSLRALCLQYLT